MSAQLGMLSVHAMAYQTARPLAIMWTEATPVAALLDMYWTVT